MFTNSLPFIWRNESAEVAANTWTYFRAIYSWDGEKSPTAYLAADPTARLWVNGRVVLTRVMRFVSPNITVEKLDLRPHLRRGDNVFVLLHHYWGVPTFQRSGLGRPGVALKGKFFETGPLWKWKDATEFLHHSHQTIGGGAHRIRFPVVMDMRNASPAIHEPDFSDKDWTCSSQVVSSEWACPILKETQPLEREELSPKCLVACGTVSSPEKMLAPFPLVPMSWLAKEGRYQNDANRIAASEGFCIPLKGPVLLQPGADGFVTLDFGKPVHGYLKIEIEDSSPGTILDFTYSELRWNLCADKAVLQENGSFDPEVTLGSPSGDRVILNSGPQTVEIPEERTCRWLMVTWRNAQTATKVKSVCWMSSQHPGAVIGTFEGGPNHVEPIVSLCLDHARVSMSDVYVDTPGREDAQWLEDIQYRAQLGAQWMGDYHLRRVTLRHTVEQQPKNGRFRIFPPENYGSSGMQSLDWGMVWIGLLYDDWMWTGRDDLLRKYFVNLVRFLEVAHTQTNSDGLLVDRTCFSDIRCAERALWDDGEIESIPNAWYHGFLLEAVTLAAAIGETEWSEKWRARASRVRKGFERFLSQLGTGIAVSEIWSPVAGARSFGQAAAVSAVFHGLVKGELSREVLSSTFRDDDGSPPPDCKRWNNPTYAYRALRCLSDCGMGKKAAAHFLERYKPYLPDGPLPEYFIPGNGQPEDPTGSHGWASVPLVWLHDTVLGVRCASPGGKQLIWQPTDVGWPIVQGKTMTPLGMCEVTVNWKRELFELKIPAGVSAEIRLPGSVGKCEVSEDLVTDQKRLLVWKNVRQVFFLETSGQL